MTLTHAASLGTMITKLTYCLATARSAVMAFQMPTMFCQGCDAFADNFKGGLTNTVISNFVPTNVVGQARVAVNLSQFLFDANLLKCECY